MVLETISYHAPKLWILLPEELKAMSENGYVMSVPADCAKYLYKT